MKPTILRTRSLYDVQVYYYLEVTENKRLLFTRSISDAHIFTDYSHIQQVVDYVNTELDMIICHNSNDLLAELLVI